VDYAEGDTPVLRVRVQELFGLADTPRLAKGRVPVMLHLLSPAQRPVQVTQDLKGFWQRTWPEVKKELKGRYPKHNWPEDPLTAPASRGARKRR
jgi:ATP-dependent helicase HrpB